MVEVTKEITLNCKGQTVTVPEWEVEGTEQDADDLVQELTSVPEFADSLPGMGKKIRVIIVTPSED